MKRSTLTLLTLLLVAVLLYVMSRRRRQNGLEGLEAHRWPGLDRPVFYATPAERRRNRE